MSNNIPERGEFDTPASADVLRDRFIEDIRLGYENLGHEAPDAGPGTYIHVLANASANAVFPALANVALAAENTDVLTAVGDALDKIREARGLPIVDPSPASGKVTVKVLGGGTANFADGDELLLPNGLRLQVNGTQTDISNGDTINVVAVDTGADGNAESGTQVQFADPPLNVSIVAVVDANGLTGGTDEESDEEKRQRILNRLRNAPGGGNVGQFIELADNASAAVQQPFVYPALGGPGSIKVVLTGSMVWQEGETASFTRQVSDDVVDTVRTALEDEISTAFEVVIQSVEDQNADVAIALKLPNDASGWLNGTNAWPSLEDSDNGKVQVVSVVNNQKFTISAQTTEEPTDNVTRIAWFNPTTKRFEVARVESSSGSSGAWVVTVDTPFDGIAVGDFVCPAADSLDEYRDTMFAAFNRLGPGENMTITDDDLASKRKYRQPTVDESFPSDITNALINELFDAHSEIRDAEYSYRSITTPGIPASLSNAPKVLVLRRLGFYPI